MPTQTQFSQATLDNFDRFKAFFDSSTAIEQVKKKTHSEKPFEWDESLMPLYSVFAKTMSQVFHSISLPDLGQKWLLDAKWADLHPDSYYKKIYGERFLVRAVNLPPIEQQGECCDAIAVASIQDPKVRSLYTGSDDYLHFESLDGGCLGASDWMLSLYFRTANVFSDAKEQIVAIARLFRKGLPLQAQVLQAFHHEELQKCPHLGLFKQWCGGIANSGTDKEIFQNTVRMMCNAPKGAYEISLPGHKVTLFKIDKNTSFLHDENAGLIEMKTLKDHMHECDILLATYRCGAFDKFAFKMRSVKELI